MDTGVLNRALLSKCLQSPREILMWNKAKLKYILYSLFVRSKRKFCGRRGKKGDGWFCVFQLPVTSRWEATLLSPLPQGAKHRGNILDASQA